MQIFGKELWKKQATKEETAPTGQQAFAYDEVSDSDAVVQDWGGGLSGQEYTYAQVPQDEVDLINKYRELAIDPDVEEAIGEVKNEVFVFEDGSKPFDLTFTDDAKTSDKVKDLVHDAFMEVYKVLDFNRHGIRLFEDWYVDGKLVLHKVVDADRPKEGIKQVIAVDPLTIRKIRQLPKPDGNGFHDPSKVREFYVYNPQSKRNAKTPDVTTVGWSTRLHGLQISDDAIAFIDSGQYDRKSGKSVGYLRKAISSFNQLRGMEDAMMIYRLARAPSRRAFYIDVGALNKNQAEAHLKDLMRRYGSKITYDPSTGSIVNRKSVLSITEDYWLPRREGKNTEISTIDGSDTTNVLEEVNYYRNRLYTSLGVPRNRFGDEQKGFNFGKGVEIDRDEYRFKKFIDRLRHQFMHVIMDLVRTQAILRNYVTPDDWEEIAAEITWTFTEDNNFVEWKNAEILSTRLAMIRDAEPIIGVHVSKEWAQKNILKMTDAEIKTEREKIAAEAADEPLSPEEPADQPEET